MARIARYSVVAALTFGVSCKGDSGAPGAAGNDGQACWDLDANGVGDVATEDQNGDGAVDALDCAGMNGNVGQACWDLNGNGTGDVATEDMDGNGVVDVADCSGANGSAGQACWDLNGNGMGDVTTEDKDGNGVVNAADCSGADGTDGQPGEPGLGYFPLDMDGLVGLVTDASETPLTMGTIYLVPASDVAALPATTIAVSSPDDEPLEDTIAANGGSYQTAAISADGRYHFDAVAAGAYFVVFVPDAADAGHLPGGSLCRTAVDAAELTGARLDIVVSSAPPATARYVGSSRCISCHGRIEIADTMHRLGIWSPGETGMLQNISARYDDMHLALSSKFTSAGTTVYFYDYDSTRGFDKYKTLESDPGTGTVSFTVTVWSDANGFYMTLHNVVASEPDQTYSVDAVYGGGVQKQRYMTRLTSASGSYLALLPLQFNQQGQEGAPHGRTSKTWRDYYGANWFTECDHAGAPASCVLKMPAVSKSFEKNCISCHAVGTEVSGSDATNWEATTVADPIYGDFDYDLDGRFDEMNLGCESCHGPGSAHWSAAGQGRSIVSPSLLTPEREAMICGQCHSRPKGALGTDSPVDSAGRMMTAGTARRDFLAQHATGQLDGATTDYYGDVDRHSKSHHQQYSDFIRSGMYKNDRQLLTCSTCHDPHARPYARQLRADPADGTTLCAACHDPEAADLALHIDTTLGLTGVGALKVTVVGITCLDCHISQTAQTGSGSPGLLVGGTDQYWQKDVTSHFFDVPDKANSKKAAPGFDMPTAYTKACAQACHGAP